MIAIPMAPHHYQRDFDDLGAPEIVAGLEANSGFIRPRVNSSSLDILSASSYFDQHSNVPHPQSVSPDVSMGYVVEEDEISDSRPIAQRKKTRGPGKGSKSVEKSKTEAISKNKRGRPKLEPHDETAADRRRTQIRLAQRAYRQRKETTIVGLKEKVTELQQIVEQMNRSFTRLHDNLIDSRLLTASSSANLYQQLQEMMEQYQQFTKNASVEWDEDDENESFNRVHHNPKKTTPSGSSRVSEEGDLADTQSFPGISEDYQFDIDMEDSRLMPIASHQTQVAPSQIAQLESTLVNAVESARTNEILSMDSDPQIERSLFSPAIDGGYYTYSFQETTFARRLHRQCIELGFRYLSNPATDPKYIMKTFRFTLTFANRKQIFARFQELLRRKSNESLENWDIPFLPIGGAGTHFPRLDADGNPVLPPNMFDPARAFGMKNPVSPAAAQLAKLTTEKVLDAIGFGGEWYDSHDVEEYLKTKGIFLDGQTSFVTVNAKILQLLQDEADVNDEGSTTSKTTVHQDFRDNASTVGLDVNIPTHNGTSPTNVGSLIQTFGQSNFLGSNHNDPEDPGASIDANTNWMWTIPGVGALHAGHAGTTSTQQTLTFDVERFLGRLTDRACCLGRAPGFRRKDVDDALRYALQDLF